MPNRVVHFEIPVTDKARAKKFYSQAFGWDMQDQGDEYGGYIIAITGPGMMDGDKLAKDPGINGGLYKVDKKDTNSYRCVIGVDDIKKAVGDVRAAGGEVSTDNKTPEGKPLGEIMDIPGIGKWAKCEDSEGNLFSLMQPDTGTLPA